MGSKYFRNSIWRFLGGAGGGFDPLNFLQLEKDGTGSNHLLHRVYYMIKWILKVVLHVLCLTFGVCLSLTAHSTVVSLAITGFWVQFL